MKTVSFEVRDRHGSNMISIFADVSQLNRWLSVGSPSDMGATESILKI